MKCLKSVTVMALCSMWWACGRYEQASYTPPDLASASGKLVIDDRPLVPGEEREGNLPNSGKYLGYIFQARGGEVYDIALERMSGGDVPALALYRFAGGDWSECLAWATADARRIAISGWQVDLDGTYLVLVDLVSGSGSSSFVLLLSCVSECHDPITCAENADCPAGQVCFEGLCLEGGIECRTDADCLPHEVCRDNFCVAVCYPTPEVCDGLDNDCDGQVDEGCQQQPCSMDADCAAGEVCLAGYCRATCGCVTDADCPVDFICVDCACVTAECPDHDGDGVGICRGDCDDTDPSVSPGAAEICNGRDEDCDGVVDEGCTGSCTSDADCAAGEICWEGSCLLPCRANVDCPAGQVCYNGVCQLVCPPGGFADCDGDMTNGCEADILNDSNNCGACGQVCASGEECAWGTCVSSVCQTNSDCPAGQVCNFGLCTYPCRTDADCPAGEVCVAGLCQRQCQDNDGDGVTDCQGDCDDNDSVVNPNAPELCDGLDNDCDGQVDEGCGSCSTDGECPAGEACCAGLCVDVLFDEQNCGACGQVCPAGEICNGGVCAQACTTDADCDDGDPRTADYCVNGVCTHR